MARYPYQNTTKDGSGKVTCSATVAVFLADTSTPASIYAASAGGVAVNSVTSGADTSSAPGYFIFWVDRTDYTADQEFDITISKSGFNTQTYPFVVIDNAADYLSSPPNHSVNGLSGLLADDQHVLDAEVLAIAEDKTKKGVASGYASLDANIKVPIAQMPSGTVVQVVNVQTGAVATGTTIMPWDDTIPQITEGDEYMSLAITPKSATNKLKIDVVIQISNNNANPHVLLAALFQDATTNALAAMAQTAASSGYSMSFHFKHWMTAGTISAITFKVRAGGQAAGTTVFNGNASGRLMGGVMASSITITEVAA